MERITPKEVNHVLSQYLRRRSDLGLWNALLAQILEPEAPFESRPRRKPQPWFVLFLAASVAAVAALVYFNFLN